MKTAAELRASIKEWRRLVDCPEPQPKYQKVCREACDALEQVIELVEHEFKMPVHQPRDCKLCEDIDKFLGGE